MATTRKDLDCLFCGNPTEVDCDARSVLCGTCTTKLAGAPATPKYLLKDKSDKIKKIGDGKFPRGWHFMKEYVHTDGTVYHRGKPVISEKTETTEISQVEDLITLTDESVPEEIETFEGEIENGS